MGRWTTTTTAVKKFTIPYGDFMFWIDSTNKVVVIGAKAITWLIIDKGAFPYKVSPLFY